MILRRLTAGSISSTGTVTVPSQILGGVLITANGTNDAVVPAEYATTAAGRNTTSSADRAGSPRHGFGGERVLGFADPSASAW